MSYCRLPCIHKKDIVYIVILFIGEKLCSQGWEEYKEHCYRFNTKLIKWHEAEV